MSNEREIGWLIERKYSNVLIGTTEPRWYAERANGDHWWTPVPNEAKRFATKADAEAYPAYQMIASDHDISITEHVWINDGFSWSHGRVAIRESVSQADIRESVWAEMLAALRKAAQLAEIATDWNLDEVEIDSEMVRTHSLRREFEAVIAKAEGSAS